MQQRQKRQWQTEVELAELLIARGHAGKCVRLEPDTAIFVGMKLMTVSEKPTIREVAMLLCNSKCKDPCYLCTGTANVIVRQYGHRNA